MGTYHLLKKVTLSASRHQATGNTRHYRNDREIPPPSELKIVSYSNDQGYYLLYLDAQGNELTDTYHESVESAMEQAAWEFNVLPDDWKNSS